MRHATFGTAGAIAFSLLMACGPSSQTLNIWPGAAPGSEHCRGLWATVSTRAPFHMEGG
jgi:hypothetical protein